MTRARSVACIRPHSLYRSTAKRKLLAVSTILEISFSRVLWHLCFSTQYSPSHFIKRKIGSNNQLPCSLASSNGSAYVNHGPPPYDIEMPKEFRYDVSLFTCTGMTLQTRKPCECASCSHCTTTYAVTSAATLMPIFLTISQSPKWRKSRHAQGVYVGVDRRSSIILHVENILIIHISSGMYEQPNWQCHYDIHEYVGVDDVLSFYDRREQSKISSGMSGRPN